MMQEAKPVTSARQNPAEISPETFTWSLLNDIFWKAGRKVRSLEIGGVTVSKSLTLYLSNSGKKHDWKVEFEYKDANGERHTFIRESRFATNRRNDPDRNFGLYE